MTPFMLRVADIVGADTTDELDLPEPALQRSVFRPINKGNDLHVAYRGLTEQLVCEANAMLPAEDDRMTLVDDVVGNEMLYSVYYRGRAAVISLMPSSSRACAPNASLAISCTATSCASAGSRPRLT